MKFGFGKKRSLADIEREAQAELDAAMARARPPRDAERTWVLPPPDVPDLLAQSRRERGPARRPGPARPAADADAEDPGEEAPAAPPQPAGKSAAARKKAQPVRTSSRSPTKRAATPRRSTEEDTGLA